MAGAADSGTFMIGGEIGIHRLGFGAMRITGRGIWGEPPDRAEVLRTLRRLPQLEVSFVDTADAYGPNTSEALLREALHPYDGILIATKAGFVRPAPHVWEICGRPDYLIEQANMSRIRLGVEQIGLWQLHRIDPKVPRDEQFAAVKSLLDNGVIRYAGLSDVSVSDIEAARQVFKVATVQNCYNFLDRGSEDVLEHCERSSIGFIAWYPLGQGKLTKPRSLLDNVIKGESHLDAIAKRHGATQSQIALAWLLKRSPAMLPIPGTSRLAHLEENVAAADITLSNEEFAILDLEGRPTR